MTVEQVAQEELEGREDLVVPVVSVVLRFPMHSAPQVVDMEPKVVPVVRAAAVAVAAVAQATVSMCRVKEAGTWNHSSN